jgi:Cellulose synthase operon protein C C-terminus (BCSC_C)
MRTFLAVIIAVTFVFCGLAAAQAPDNSGIQRPVRQQEIDQLKQQIDEDTRSGVEAIVDYHTETGDLNNRLDSFRYGGRLNYKFGSSSAFQFTGTRTNYMPITSIFGQQGTNFTVGVQSKFSDSIQAHAEAGATHFSTDTTTVNALATVAYTPSDSVRVYATVSRSNVEESLLSITGVRPTLGPFAGQLVGNVMENRFVVGGSTHLDYGFDIFGEGGAGNRVGSNVPSNFFKTIGGGVGYSIVSGADTDPLSLVRAAYELNYFGYDDNRFGFGGASLLTRGGFEIAPTRIGSDGISPNVGITNPGVGGYFSPNNFVSNIVRVEAKGAYGTTLNYSGSVFLGSQNYTGSTIRLAKGLSGTVTIGLTDHLSFPITYLIDNFGPYRQQTLFARLAVKF